MLKRVTHKNDSIKKKVALELSTPLPNSKKIYMQSKRFANIKVGMRKIILQDKTSPYLIVYDTSGIYTDSNYEHDLNQGLPKLRLKWIKRRSGVGVVNKTKLRYLKPSNNQGEEFINLSLIHI